MTTKKKPDNSKSWVWFDLDDTLWDFTANSHHTLEQVYTVERLDRFWPDVDSWRDAYHAVNSELWSLYAPGLIDRDTLRTERFARPLREAGVDADTAMDMARRLDPLYLDLLSQHTRTLPGARELLEALSPHYNIGILSNGFAGTQQAKLASSQLDKYIDCIVLSDAIDINKPDVRIFRYAEHCAHTGADQCTLIGDNPDTDICGALNAGWCALWFNPQQKKVPDEMSGNPDIAVINTLDITAICAFLDRHHPQSADKNAVNDKKSI